MTNVNYPRSSSTKLERIIDSIGPSIDRKIEEVLSKYSAPQIFNKKVVQKERANLKRFSNSERIRELMLQDIVNRQRVVEDMSRMGLVQMGWPAGR